MAREATAQKLVDSQGGEERRSPGVGGGPPFSPPPSSAPSLVSNARLGLLMFLGAESMFFAGLVGAFLVFRLGSESWPPPAQPRLPVAVTGMNSLILGFSGLSVHLALKAIRGGRLMELLRWLLLTAVLGTLFLAVQGYEWVRLVRFGLTLSSGTYGATFYTLIGFHGLHVLAALVWLVVVFARAARGRFSAGNLTGVEICAMYWGFVVLLWPILYVLVYLF